jgi:quinoprotein glucose dehydrogenase
MGGEQQVAQQSALETLGKLKTESAADMLASFLRKMNANDFPANLRLDVAMAAQGRSEEDVNSQYLAYMHDMVEEGNPAAAYKDSLMGGDDAKGSSVFYGKTEVSCVRCHRIDGTGGEVGPDLSSIGLTKDRQYLLESIVDPNKIVTDGYTQVKVMTDEGDLFVGVVKRETDKTLVLMDADGKQIVIQQEAIEDRKPGKSSMPDDLVRQLSNKEIRDLVEFLSNRKTKPAISTEHE